MGTKKELESQIVKLKRARNVLIVCGVLAAGTGSAVALQLVDSQAYARAQVNARTDAVNRFQTEHGDNLQMSAQLETILQICLAYESTVRQANAANGGSPIQLLLGATPSRYVGPTKCTADG